MNYASNLFQLAILSAGLLLGCVAGEGDESKADQGEVIESNQRKWDRSKPDAFTYELRRDCYCDSLVQGPFLVTASKDSVLAVRRILISGDTIDVVEGRPGYSIDAVFADLASRMGKGNEVSHIRFDSKFGFPDSAYFDWRIDFHDDEYGLQLRMINP